MLKDMLSFLCQSLFGMTQCTPGETQLPGEKETEAIGNCRKLQAGVHEKAESKESSRSTGTPKKTTVLIMVAPPSDFQQVG